MPNQRWFLIMSNLLYPAVLGTVIYTFAEKILDPTDCITATQQLAGLMLITLFIFDYSHTLIEGIRVNYNGRKFFADFVIILCILLAGRAILGKPVPLEANYAWWLFFAKTSAVLWELFDVNGKAMKAASRKLPNNFFGFETDLFLCVVYAAIIGLAYCEFRYWEWCAISAMLFDAYQYYQFTKKQ